MNETCEVSFTRFRLDSYIQASRIAINRLKTKLTCMESALMISPLNLLAISIANLLLPVPVEPKITTIGNLFTIFPHLTAAILTQRENERSSSFASLAFSIA